MKTLSDSGGSTPHFQKSSITNLPPEVLSIIFKFAHENTNPIMKNDIIPTWMRMEGLESFQQSVMALAHPTIPEDPKSPTLFPYSLAAVCSFWRDVLCAHPDFWTLVVLFIGSKPTPTADASLFLEWSRNHQIDVFIARRDQLHPTSHPDVHEKNQIHELLRVLKPHLHRCCSLHIDAHLSSSLPIIHKTFDRIKAPYLKSMELVCDIHTFLDNTFPDNKEDGDSDSDVEDEFEPCLTHLVVDGKFFRQSTVLNSNKQRNWLMDLRQITIADYEPDENDGYILGDFYALDAMGPLQQLKFKGLRFAVRPHYNIYPFLQMRYIHLEEVRADFISDVFMFVEILEGPSVLRITRSHLPGLYGFSGVPKTLILEDIGAEVDLLNAIDRWVGKTLWLDRCLSFSGMFLEALGGQGLRGWPCIEMQQLLLCRLPKFKISSLKKMVRKRNAGVHYGDPNWRSTTVSVPFISHLAVVQCGMGDLSVEDYNWFQSHLVEFYWIP